MQVRSGRLYYYDVRSFLARYFGQVGRRVIWRNLPPAFVFECRL
jgi:hypothetical protein